MSFASGVLRGGALLGVVFAAGWVGAHVFLRDPGSENSLPSSAATSSAVYDSASLPLHGRLTATARVGLANVVNGRGAVVVLLDSTDLRVCEDLGRQLRLLVRRAGPDLPLVLISEPEALPSIRAFARRERLRPAAFVGASPDRLIVGITTVPTPAAAVVRGGASLSGVAHPSRFRNIRIRSFADELSADLPAAKGGPSAP